MSIRILFAIAALAAALAIGGCSRDFAAGAAVGAGTGYILGEELDDND